MMVVVDRSRGTDTRNNRHCGGVHDSSLSQFAFGM
jgi:hypothetical protein